MSEPCTESASTKAWELTAAMRHLRLLRRLPFGPAVLVLMTTTVVASGAPGWRWQAPGTVGARTAPAVLVDLQSVAELRTQFNSDRGNARLVLLLSPT